MEAVTKALEAVIYPVNILAGIFLIGLTLVLLWLLRRPLDRWSLATNDLPIGERRSREKKKLRQWIQSSPRRGFFHIEMGGGKSILASKRSRRKGISIDIDNDLGERLNSLLTEFIEKKVLESFPSAKILLIDEEEEGADEDFSSWKKPAIRIKHLSKKQIEPGDQVVFVSGVLGKGRYVAEAAEKVRERGAEVVAMVTMVNRQNIDRKELGFRVISVLNLSDLRRVIHDAIGEAIEENAGRLLSTGLPATTDVDDSFP